MQDINTDKDAAAIANELVQSSLIVNELTVLNKSILTVDRSNAAIFLGTGLVTGKKLTQGLPLDFLGYLLAAERARRAFGLGRIVHLIADNHAKHEIPEQAQQISDMADHIKTASLKTAAKLGLTDKFTVVLASEIHSTPEFQALFTETGRIEETGVPAQAVNYLKTQMADMEYLRRYHRAAVKLSWVLERKILRGNGGFDEKFFDNAYAKVFGDNLSYVYTLSGRTFDSAKPRSSPYVSTDPATRLMLWPAENIAAKLNRLTQEKSRTAEAALEHLGGILKEYESLIAPVPADTLDNRIAFLAQLEGVERPFWDEANTSNFKIKATEITMPHKLTDVTDQLHYGAAILTPPNGLKEKLDNAHKNNIPLIVKLGFDPTAPDLHLGHAVVLRKMRQFQDAGHKLVVIIGDFTARIGDPTGRNKARPPLSEDAIKQNAKTYLDQLSKVLDMDVAKLDIRFNSEWLGKMNFTDVVKLLSKVTVAQLMQRDDFNNRYKNNIPISMHELLYPLMQGYDSLALNADIEMGGTDQLFNCLIGRTLQESEGKPGQVVVSMPLLVGLDGKEKMSKSHNNYIGLTEEPDQMYGKAMSAPDHLLPNYLDLATDFPLDEIIQMKKGLEDGTLHPMEIKKAIARNIVKQYHGEESATAAALFFYNQFQKKDDTEKSYKNVSAELVFRNADSVNLLELCAKLQPEVSKNQIRRLITANAVSVNDEKVVDPHRIVQRPDKQELRLKIGKRGFFALTPDSK